MRTASILGVSATILTLVNLTALLAVASATHMAPHTRVMALGGHLAALIVFAALTGVLFRRASA